MVFFFAISIFQIKAVCAKLVWHNHILVIRNSFCDPVVTANCLQPPDFIFILKGNSVHLIGSVSFQKHSQTFHALSCRRNIGKSNCHHILLSDTSHSFRFIALSLFVAHQRIPSGHSGIGGKSFCCCHGNIFFIDTVSAPYSLHCIAVWKVCILQRSLRKRDFHMGKHRFIYLWLIFRLHHFQPLGAELS